MPQNQTDYLSINDLQLLVERLEKSLGADILCNQAIFNEIIEKTNGYLSQFPDPSPYKAAGTITFWIRKLKPFSFVLTEDSTVPTNYLNEAISVFYGYNYLRAYKKNKKEEYPTLSKKFLVDLTVQLRYSSFSPSSIAMLFWALCHER